MPPTEDWIQESLARLESLEEERNRHEAALETATDPAVLRMNAQAIERLDAKIRSLYAELEAAAEQGEEAGEEEAEELADAAPEEDAGTNETTTMFHRDTLAAQATSMNTTPAAAAPVQAAAPVRVAAAVAAAAAPVSSPVASPFGGVPASPFGGPPASTPTASPFGGAPTPTASPFGGAPTPTASPFGGAPAAAPFSGGGEASPFGEVPVAPFGSSQQSPMSSNSFDAGNSFDEESSGGGGGAKWGIIIGVVLVLGIGGYFALGGKKEEPPPAEPTGPAKVLKAGEVPPDTQGPKTVKGSDVDAIKGTQFKEGRPSGGGGGGGGGSNNAAPASDKPKKKDPRAKIESTDDPLAGIDK